MHNTHVGMPEINFETYTRYSAFSIAKKKFLMQEKVFRSFFVVFRIGCTEFFIPVKCAQN